MYSAYVELGTYKNYERARQAVRKFMRTQTSFRSSRQPPSWTCNDYKIKNLDVKTSK